MPFSLLLVYRKVSKGQERSVIIPSIPLAMPTKYIFIQSPPIPFFAPNPEQLFNAHEEEELEKGRRVYELGVVSSYPREVWAERGRWGEGAE